MSRPNRVLAQGAAGAQEDLHAAGALPKRDRLLFALRQRGLELDRAEDVERDRNDRGRRLEELAAPGLHLDATAASADGRHGRFEPCLDGRGRGDRLEQRARAVGQRHASARELREREAVARERMRAQHGDGSDLVEWSARQGLELRLEHGSLLRVEVELLDPLGDRQPVETGQLVEREQRVVRIRQRFVNAVDKAVQPRAAIASRSAMVPSRRSPPTHQWARSASGLSSTRRPARVIPDQVCA
jgi:hypothetical protein